MLWGTQPPRRSMMSRSASGPFTRWLGVCRSTAFTCAAFVLSQAYTAPAGAFCVGDCSGTSIVTISDILTLVNIALGNAQPSACPNGIPDGAQVDIALILEA